jgi:hypothetical protein
MNDYNSKFREQQLENCNPQNSTEMRKDLMQSLSFQASKMIEMHRSPSTMPLVSMETAMLTDRLKRVRFRLPGCMDASILVLKISDTDSETYTPPAKKRRRFERRNSQTAAMLSMIQQDFNSSISSLDDSLNDSDSWGASTDSTIVLAENIVQNITKQRQRRSLSCE